MADEIPAINTVDEVIAGFERQGYVTDSALATAVFLVIKLGKPILVEGPAGVGKTEVAKVLASMLGTELIRLQCYEGLDASSAIYEWNYQKQLLAIKIQETANSSIAEKEQHIFGREFLLERPLLRSILAKDRPPVLLVDEIDRADEGFEAFLLELLSDFQITVPEMGTIKASHVPFVVLTSNRSRELGDALKRRCLYHWIPYPTVEKELRIVRARLPGIDQHLGSQIVRFVQNVRQMDLKKPPGVVETLDAASALVSLARQTLDAEAADATLGCIVKSSEDIEKIKAAGIDQILSGI
jgi:MoxR-like ATPase